MHHAGRGGAITASCHHDSCLKRNWKDFRAKIDPHYRVRGRLPTAKTVRDAEYQARRFLETCPPAYLYRGAVWFYNEGIWKQVDKEDTRNLVCRSLMRVYGEYANWLRENRKQGSKVPSVAEGTISNVLRCLKSILPHIRRDWGDAVLGGRQPGQGAGGQEWHSRFGDA